MSKYKFRADEVHVSTLFGRHLPLSVEVEMDTPQAKHAFMALAGDTRLNELGEWMQELGYTITEIKEAASTKDTGGRAFPMPTGHAPAVGVECWNKPEFGMTLRDYFAVKAMASILTQPEWEEMPTSHVALWAYEFSDAMLKERGKE